MYSLLSIILMAPPAEGGKSNPASFYIMMLLIIVVFYFFMIRPQVRKQKEMRNFRSALKKGDKVITTGGIYGKINNISENIITIDVGNNVIIKVDKNAILKDNSDLQTQQK
ncbi:MAG: preprotein translocase subunit YajC [Bacteroidales bacterium]|nr:preprotein translocase subunit YajC [Bacteroidales bacterium]